MEPGQESSGCHTYAGPPPAASGHTRCTGLPVFGSSWECPCWGVGRGGIGSDQWCPPPHAGGCCAAGGKTSPSLLLARDPPWKEQKIFLRGERSNRCSQQTWISRKCSNRSWGALVSQHHHVWWGQNWLQGRKLFLSLLPCSLLTLCAG